MNEINPLVSIMALCYNHSKFVVQALDSIKNQTYKNIELFIIDDNSSDNSVIIIDNWIKENNVQCTFIKHAENKPICYSYNEFLALAKGSYISSIATDDVYELHKIEKQLKLFENLTEEYGVVYGDMHVIDEDGKQIAESYYRSYLNINNPTSGDMIEPYIEKCAVHVLGCLVKKSVYDTVGSYDESLAFEDWDMGFRWARVFKFYYHSDTVAKYRKFSGQMTDVFWKEGEKFVKIQSAIINMYFKHLDLQEPYKNKILNKIKEIHAQLIHNKNFFYKENNKLCRKILKQSMSMSYLVLSVFCLLDKPKLYFSLKTKISKLYLKLA